MDEIKNLNNAEQGTNEPQAPTKKHRKIQLRAPIAFVDAPEEKEPETTENAADGETQPAEKPKKGKLKKFLRGVSTAGLIIGTGLVAAGSYLKGKKDAEENQRLKELKEELENQEPDEAEAEPKEESDEED